MAAGKVPVNHQIVYHLQDALNLLPDLSDQVTTHSFASSTNDSMLVVYLSSLLRAVIALHGLVDNKATIGRAEMEEEDKKEKEKEKEKDVKEKDATEKDVTEKDANEKDPDSKDRGKADNETNSETKKAEK
jgi:26S proteasome regulatory subunit N8